MRWGLLVACLLGALAWVLTIEVKGQESYEASPGLLLLGGFVVFFDAQGPLSYPTLTAAEVPNDAISLGSVTGRGCQYGLSIPIVGASSLTRVSGGVGRGGFQKAIGDIRQRHPELRGIYDVKVDSHLLSVLTVFSRRCVEISARGFK
jgi:hypothetical protein